MIPVTVAMHIRGEHGAATKEFHYEILNNARLSPLAMMATVFNALHGTNEYGEDITYRMKGVLSVKGYPDVTLRNMFAPQDNGQPAAASAAATIGDRFGRIYTNAFETPDVEGVKLDFDLVRERRSARLEAARTDMSEARPGDQIMVETVIRPIAASAWCGRFLYGFRPRHRRARCAFWSATETRSTVCTAEPR